MRSLRHNLDTSRAILEWLQRRERRKRDIIQCEIDLQLLNMKLRHDPPQAPATEKARDAERPAAEQPTGAAGAAAGVPAAAAAAAAAAAVDPARRGDMGAAPALAARPQMPPPAFDPNAQKQNKKRRRDGRDRRIVPGADQPYVPPPTTPEIQMLFAEPPNLVRMHVLMSRMRWLTVPAPQLQLPGMRMPAVLRGVHCRARFGRGGRLVLDRVHPTTREPYLTRDPSLVAYRSAVPQSSQPDHAPPVLADADAAR